jgi:hypothetical protein
MERPEFHPLPEEPDKYETPAAKVKRLRDQKEGWEDLTKELDSEQGEKEKAA